jgi:predicted ATPase
MLLVLDNFEQIMKSAPLVGELLSASSGVKVLVTSREVLRIYGEQGFPVPPLSLPDAEHLPPLERLTQFDAVRLFVERAMAVKPDFEVTNENAPAVAEICYRLDGLPLAIELAAARIRLLPPQAILARLQSHALSQGEGRLKLLTGGARDLPARQQTLRNAIEWSYDLLDESEKQLFRRLAVFRGGRTLEAIEAVCDPGGEMEIDILDSVESLLGKSLLRQEEGAEAGEPRFVMLETIHEYARERLEESGEARATGLRHARYFLDLVEKSEKGLLGHEQPNWLRRLDAEYDNIRAALSWAATYQPDVGFRLAGALSMFWEIRGYLSEGRRILSDLLSHSDATASTAEKAKALNVAGNLADVAGDFDAAHLCYEESLAIFRALGDKHMASRPLNGLGIIFWKQGDFAAARSSLEESLAIKRELADKPGTSVTLNNLGVLALEQGDYAAARAYFQECLLIDRELKDEDAIATSLGNLGAVALDEGNNQEARSLLLESILLFQKVGDKLGIADSLEKLVGLAGQTGDFERAPVLGGAAEGLREEISAPLSPSERARYERYLAPARSQLDPAMWEERWAEGRGLSTEQAIALCTE